MVEVHGWITLRYSDYHSENDKQNDFVYAFKQFIQANYHWIIDDQIGLFTNRNGLNCFTIVAQHNHADSPFYPFSIFTWVAGHSTGSYGMLYVYDDEDKEYHNEFQVFILKRGKLIKAQDPFLSPYIGEVEKEYDENNPPRD